MIRMIATQKDNGRQMRLKLRGKLEVRLPEYPAAGYLWEYRERCPCVAVLDSDYEESGPARFTGCGERRWQFRAVATGECVLDFFLVRPWSTPSAEFRLTIEVR
jgi:predicted secreted protein